MFLLIFECVWERDRKKQHPDFYFYFLLNEQDFWLYLHEICIKQLKVLIRKQLGNPQRGGASILD